MANVDPRRKTLGRRIQRARERAGYSSQREFAEAIDMSEASVANAERGDTRVGKKTYGAIEDKLDWPEGCIQKYLDSGDETVLAAEPVEQVMVHSRPETWAHVDDLPPEMIREWVRVGMRMLPQVREHRGEEVARRTEDRLIELAGKAAQADAQSTTDDADQGS